MKQKNSILFAVVMIAMIMLAACGGSNAGSNPTSAPQATAPGPNASVPTANMPAAGDVVFDSALVTNADTLKALAYAYEGLVSVKDGQAAPALAESWTVSEDGLDYIFNLRVGVKFHDGSDLNADVVTANFDRWFDPTSPYRGSGSYDAWKNAFGGFKGDVDANGKPASAYDGIEKVNDYTVLVHLNRVMDDFLTKIADPAFSIVSTKAMSAGSFGTNQGADGGSGPYTFTFGSGTIDFTPYAGYWNTSAIPTDKMSVPVK